ncbi:hypothetical protein Avbf_06512 [Armadillidium vulgare]|nr:hypothetical protein Avbf_06512 [Armadillidium vulgare]
MAMDTNQNPHSSQLPQNSPTQSHNSFSTRSRRQPAKMPKKRDQEVLRAVLKVVTNKHYNINSIISSQNARYRA